MSIICSKFSIKNQIFFLDNSNKAMNLSLLKQVSITNN